MIATASAARCDDTVTAIAKASEAAVRLFKEGRYGDAVPYAQEALALTERKYASDHAEVATALANLGMVLRFNNQYDKSEQVYRRLLEMRERLNGAEHEAWGHAALNVAAALEGLERFNDAERLYRRAITVLEKALGGDHADVGTALANLASLYHRLHKNHEAAGLLERALAIAIKQKPLNIRELVSNQVNLATVLQELGRIADAETLYKQAMDIVDTEAGPESPLFASVLHSVATFYLQRGQHREAAPLMERSLALQELRLGREHVSLVTTLTNLAVAYRDLDRWQDGEKLLIRALRITEAHPNAPKRLMISTLNHVGLHYQIADRLEEAERYFQRALAIAESSPGSDDAELIQPLTNLASVYLSVGRRADAILLFERSLAISERVYGPIHGVVAVILNNIRGAHARMGFMDKAEPFAKRALDIYLALHGDKHPDVGKMQVLLGGIQGHQGRTAEAEALMLRGISVLEAAYSADSTVLATPLRQLGQFYSNRGRHTEADAAYERSIAIAKRHGNSDEVARSTREMAFAYAKQRHWQKSMHYYRQAEAIKARDVEIEAMSAGRGSTEQFEGRLNHHVMVDVGYRLSLDEPNQAAELKEYLFTVAQRAIHSDASGALEKMSMRLALADPELRKEARERQDLSAEKLEIERRIVAGRARDKVGQSLDQNLAERTRLEDIDLRLAAIDRRLTQAMPSWRTQHAQAPMSIEDVQLALREDEVLVFAFSTAEMNETIPSGTYIWAISKAVARLEYSNIGLVGVAKVAGAVRCGLDYAAWDGKLCKDVLSVEYSAGDYAAGKPLPFDLQRAHELYRVVFGKIEDVIAGKTILVVPTFAMARVPLHALVTETTSSTDFVAMRDAAWLAKRNAITVLPAVSSLKALRAEAQPSAAKQPYLGIGNPLLDGPDARYAGLAESARSRSKCIRPPEQATASLVRRAAPDKPTYDMSKPEALRRLFSPLPETADEICAVAELAGGGADDIILGDRATEDSIKSLNSSGRLADYRVIHFATHGYLGGRLGKNPEPGLVLTPPGSEPYVEDGYLSASEIAQLKLDAEFVILSACNTAGTDGTHLQSLDGLAQSFLYAGARAVLVSSWEVDSAATVKLVTGMVAALASANRIGRSEALRRAMVSLIEQGQPREAHPSIWAPFAVVGESAPIQVSK